VPEPDDVVPGTGGGGPAVLGELDLDEVLGRTVGAAALGAALGAEADHGAIIRIGGLRAAQRVAQPVLEGLIAAAARGLGDVGERALAHVHELAVAPVRAHGEVRPVVVVAVVEEQAHRAGREPRVREARADDAHEQAAVVDEEARVVSPSAAVTGLRPPPGEGLDGDAVPQVGEAVRAHGELDEGEG